MTLPNQERCRAVIKSLETEPALSTWEASFVEANRGRKDFTDPQKIVVAQLMEKYETK